MTERGQRTRAKLLQVTVDLVREVGYAQTTTRAVAQAAGVSEGTIYRHFPDKPTLLLAAAIEQHAPIVAWMGELPARAGQGEVAETLSDCLSRLATMRQTLLPLELAILTDPELAAARNSIELPEDIPDPPKLLAEYLAAEQRLGRVRAEVDPTELAVLLLAALFGLMVMPADGPRSDIVAPSLRGVVDMILRGVAST